MNICNNCKHHIEYHGAYGCKKHYRTSCVTGRKIYDGCSMLNTHGDCEDYEPNFITRLINKIEKLFNKQ